MTVGALANLQRSVFTETFPRRAAERRRREALDAAVSALAQKRPDFSARRVIATWQKRGLLAAAGILFAAFCLLPRLTAQALVAVMSAGFLVSLGLRLVLAWLGRKGTAAEEAYAEGLPVYTVLVPLYHEAAMLPQLCDALAAIDYPPERLDLKLVIEADDGDTRAAAAASPYEIVLVPPCLPRTKPKACNYALAFARGQFLVVFDAEDRPEPDQLLKAVAAFRRNPGIACFQARLCIDNGEAGWLARMFALDYGTWFNLLMPGLGRFGAPMPLGGTSNHFRTSSLCLAGAWDPYNVTEDADLGLRLARLGMGVAMLGSATFEEAPLHLGPWFRQRTRWMKGYMQTLLVHTRAPRRLFTEVGWRGLLSMAVMLGGAVWSSLVNPLLWLVFVASCLCHRVAASVPDRLALIAGLSLLAANILLAALALTGRSKARRLADFCYALSYPAYWLLLSAAACRALWQLLRDPFRWEKTPHGAG
jgi:glycosyltransferase XagB